jgi:hypothetical protein
MRKVVSWDILTPLSWLGYFREAVWAVLYEVESLSSGTDSFCTILRKTTEDPAATMFPDEIVERRSKPRVQGAFPATIHGTTAIGEPFVVQTRLDNLSVGGLHLRLKLPVAVASPLFANIRLPGIEVRAKGIVNRIERESDDGSFGLGVAFKSYRVYSAPSDMNDRDILGRQF